MAFSLYLDGECLSTSCTYVEYTSGELQYNDSNGPQSMIVKVYKDNDSSDFIYEGPDDLYLTTTYAPGSGSGGNTPGDDTPITVTFNYYVNGVLVDDDKFEAIRLSSGLSVDEIWPRTLECYHIRFDKINPTEDSNPGTSGSTQYNSLEFTYVSDLVDTSHPNTWPSTGSLDNTKIIQAFSNTYFSKDKCVTINGVEYKAGENFSKKPEFHYGGTKSVVVNLYYTVVQVSTIVRTYNRDSSIYNIEEKINNNTYLNRDLWGYISVGLNRMNDSSYTYQKIMYDVPLTSGYEVICAAMNKSGFEFVKWVNTRDVEKIHANTTAYSEERQSEIDKLTALKDETGAENDRDTGAILHLSAYENHDVTAIFEPVKNEVKLYKGLDFYGSDTYYIWGGDNKWKNSVNSDVNIKIPTREGAKLLGWVEYKQPDNGTGKHPYITRSQYQEAISLYKTQEEAFNVICLFNEEIIKGVIRINNPDDETPEAVLLSGVDGYTDRYGNWLTGNKTLYPLWIVEEYPITYVSEGKDDLVVDETDIDEENGQRYVLKPEDYDLPLTYTICGDNEGKDIVFKALEKQPNIDFPVYYSFDKWEPSEIKKFTKTGEQTIVAHWVLDTYKITLEKNNNYANQSVKIKIGQSTFVGDEKVKAPTTRTAYKSFEGWYTKNNEYTNNGDDLLGKLIINKEGVLQPNVEGYTDSEGKWIKKENTTVYAKWTPEEYTITYHLEGISNPLEGILNPIKHTYTIEDTKIKIINSGSSTLYEVLENGLPLLDSAELNYLTGKSLDCWYTNANYTGTKKQYLEKGSYGDKTFYGIYKTAEYTIEYDNIREETCINYEKLPTKHTYGSVTDLIDPVFPLHKFYGWYTDENFENPISSIPADYSGSSIIKLYAKKVLQLIPIYYKDSEGNDLYESSFNSTPPVSYDYEKGTLLVEAHKNGYTFDGWYDNQECTGNSFIFLGAEKCVDFIILYCKFTPISYNITWEPNGGTIPSSPAYTSGTVEYNTPIIKPGDPTKNCYVFTNWKDQNGNTRVESNMPAKNLTYTAQYVGKTITITWNPNCNELLTIYTTYRYGESVVPQSLTRTGYTFLGWSTTQDGTNIQTEFGGTAITADSVTYYACWEEGYSDVGLEQINTILEQISDSKVATFKWINNIFGEPEKTVWNIGQTNFFTQNVDLQKYSPLSGHCVKYNDTWVGSGDSSDDKCPIQSVVVDLYKYARDKHFYLDINSIEGNKISFTSSLEGTETNDNLPNYPGTDGFIMYFSINDSNIIYKTTISHTTKSTITVPNTNNIEKINIHRIPCYAMLYEDYIDYFYPLLCITNNVSNLSIIDNTPMKKIIMQ